MDNERLTALRSLNSRSRTPSPIRGQRRSSLSPTPSRNSPPSDDHDNDHHHHLDNEYTNRQQQHHQEQHHHHHHHHHQQQQQHELVENDLNLLLEEWKSPMATMGKLSNDIFSPAGNKAIEPTCFPPLSPKLQSPTLTSQSPLLLQSKKNHKILFGYSSSSPTNGDINDDDNDNHNHNDNDNDNDNDSGMKHFATLGVILQHNKDDGDIQKRKKERQLVSSKSNSSIKHVGHHGGKNNISKIKPLNSHVPIAWPAEDDNKDNNKKNGKGYFPEFGLKYKRQRAARESNIARLQLIKNGVNVIDNLPLSYLYSKPEMKLFALEKACRRLIKPASISLSFIKKEYFSLWKYAPPSVLNDKQVGFLVIAKCVEKLYIQRMKKKFRHWQFEYTDKYKEERLQYYHDTATYMQHWWLNLKQSRSEAWKKLHAAVQV